MFRTRSRDGRLKMHEPRYTNEELDQIIFDDAKPPSGIRVAEVRQNMVDAEEDKTALAEIKSPKLRN